MSSVRRPGASTTPSQPVARPATAAAPPDRAGAIRALAVAAATLLTLTVLLLGAGRADAHNTVQSTDPADGSTVATAPDRVTLTFDQPAQALGTEIVVLGPAGAVVSTGAAELVETAVSQAVTGELPAGTYTVRWRVTSADGHPLSDEFAFTAQAASGAAPDPEPTQAPTPIAAVPADQPTAEATQDPAAVQAEDEEASLAAGAIVAIGVAVLAVGAVAWFVVRERRRSKNTRAED